MLHFHPPMRALFCFNQHANVRSAAVSSFIRPSLPISSRHRPAATPVMQRTALQFRRAGSALHDGDHQIAFAGNGHADGLSPCSVGEIVVSRPARHVSNPHYIAMLQRAKPWTDQIKVCNAVDLIIVCNTTIAIAEADLGTNVKLHLGAAEAAAQR